MSSSRLERWVVVEGDRAWGQRADCCDRVIESGRVVIARPHACDAVFLHEFCVSAALYAAGDDLDEFPTGRAVQLAGTVGLGAARAGVRLR